MPLRELGDIRFFAFESFSRFVNLTSVVTTRHGGESQGVYASFNLGLTAGEDATVVERNRARLSAFTSLEVSGITCGRQVHGTAVAVVGAEDAGRRYEDTDALITDVPDIPLVVFVADCVPVALYDPVRRAVGIVHAGWRGTAAGIVGEAVRAMYREFGSEPEDIVAGIGPSIGPCCYEVRGDVVDRFHAEHPDIADVVLSSPEFASAGSFEGVNDDAKLLDLWTANRLQLVGAGLDEASIETAEICTSCNTDTFYSYRREKNGTGRQAALVMLHQRTKRSY